MNDNEYMSISAFAEVVGVSTQNIYERIRKKDNAIQRYIMPDSKPVKIHISAVKELYNKTLQSTLSSALQSENKSGNTEGKSSQTELPLQTSFKDNEKEKDTEYLKVIAILENEIAQKNKELESKDKIIVSITDRLKESQRLLDQQQQLALADKQKILELEERTKVVEQPQQKKWYSGFLALLKGE